MKTQEKQISDKTIAEIAQMQQEVLEQKIDESAIKLAISDGVLFFAETNESGNVLAFCSAKPICEDEIEIYDIATVAEHRRKGLARKVLGKLLDFAEQFSIKKIFLEVRQSNTAAINLYAKLGFEEYNLRKNYYADGENAICMRKLFFRNDFIYQ